MHYGSLRMMLQKSLHQLELMQWLERHLNLLESSPSGQARELAANLPPIHLCRRRSGERYPVRYAWSGLLRIEPQLRCEGYAIATRLSSITVDGSGLQPTHVAEGLHFTDMDDAGYLYFLFPRQTLDLWLQQYIRCALIPPAREHPVSSSLPWLPPNLVARRLKLSAIAFLQYSHARVGALQATAAADRQGASPGCFASPLQYDRLLWQLVALQDALADSNSPQRQKLQLGCDLCAAFYEWEQQVMVSLDQCCSGDCLGAIQKALYELLHCHCEESTPVLLS